MMLRRRVEGRARQPTLLHTYNNGDIVSRLWLAFPLIRNSVNRVPWSAQRNVAPRLSTTWGLPLAPWTGACYPHDFQHYT